jgi:hypothetical protein
MPLRYGTLSFMHPLMRLSVVATFLLLAVPVHAAGESLSLSLFRAVRLSDTSITVSFVSNTSAIATLIYAGPGDRTVTLTDTIPQTDHLFTLDELNASAAYNLNITANAGAATSSTYIVLLSPASIGPAGQSIVPAVQELDGKGAVISSTLAASTTPAESNQAPLAAAIGVIALGYLGTQAYAFMRQRAQKGIR